MPVRRRNVKRRADPAAEMAAWAEIFDTEYDLFGEGAAFGLALDEHGRADRSDAEDAWARLGALFLEQRRPDPARQPWALEQFGEPPCW